MINVYHELWFLLIINLFSFITSSSISSLSSLSSSNVMVAGRGEAIITRRRCETIALSFCRHIGYNETILPNLLNHDSQATAGLNLHTLTPLIKVNCSEDLKLLLCAVFFPPCTILETPLPPCRSICLSSKNGCENLIMEFGFDWPDYLDCNKFADVEPCVSRSGTQIVADPSLTSPSTDQGELVTNGAANINRFACPLHFMAPKGSGYVLRLNGKSYHDCTTPCDGLLFNKNDRKIISGWVLMCSIFCLVSSLFTLSTHLIEPKRFGYPEKALKFLAICYSAIAFIHIIGFLFGDRIACNEPFPPPAKDLNVPMISTIVQGTSKSVCTLTFMVLYFFGHSSYIWFTLMTFTWFIAFCYGWGREGFERIANWFHVFAWAIPALEMIRILALRQIEGDPLSGVCFLDFWNREEHRHFTDSGLYILYLSLCIIFLITGFYYSCRLHHDLKADGRDTYRMDNLLCRVSIFSIFYLISSFILIGCNIYETSNLDSWMLNWQQNVCLRPESGIPCPFKSSDDISSKPNINYFLLKYVARLVPGITLSFHLFSQKTYHSWLNFIRKFGKRICCIGEPSDTEKKINQYM